jgi:hypothetical protein
MNNVPGTERGRADVASSSSAPQRCQTVPTPYESATLNLKLFDMRREPELRRARSWFITEFHPTSADEYFAALSSDKNAWMRMVIGYWDMAASMVIPPEPD